MSYFERDTVPYHDPRPPVISDEEAQQLRDLWRPSMQATWQPHTWVDHETGELRHREKDFDTTKVSLWMDYPMYVIPPAIAEPLNEQLAEQIDGPMFRTTPDWERSVLHGASRFMQRFLWANRWGQFVDDSRGNADTNFNHQGEPTGFLASGSDRYPHVGVPAPVLERKIDHKEGEVRRIIDTPEDYGALIFTEGHIKRQQREGILGWTIPFTHKDTNFFAHAILRAKNHLIDVNWYDFPRESLSLTFRYPQLTPEGEAMLGETVAELEHLLPEGTDYTELYNYYERVVDWGYPRDVWRDTNEDRDKRQKKHDRARDDWMRARPQAY